MPTTSSATPPGDGSEPREVQLRLYIAGGAPNSILAVANLNTLIERSLGGHCILETVDLLRDPQRALSDGVFVTPLLVKIWPEPVRSVAGSLTDLASVLVALGLEAHSL